MLGKALPITVWSSAESISTSEMPSIASKACLKLRGGCTGAVIAAATFGLPETPGGERNWDYRYTWIRDASFTVYAFMRLGFVEEANGFMRLRRAGLDYHEYAPLKRHADLASCLESLGHPRLFALLPMVISPTITTLAPSSTPLPMTGQARLLPRLPIVTP